MIRRAWRRLAHCILWVTDRRDVVDEAELVRIGSAAW